MNLKRYILSGLALVTGMTGITQTANTGELTIMPNTQFSVLDSFNNTTTGSVLNDGEVFFYNHYNNDGVFTYVDASANAISRFIGSQPQQISGSQWSEFYTVYFNNPALAEAFQLSNAIFIDHQAIFDEGIVDNRNYNGEVIFNTSATHTGVYDGSHVNGWVHKRGDEGFEFPIGNGEYYRNATISAPDTMSEIRAIYHFENSNAEYPHDLKAGVINFINDTEYWEIERLQGDSHVLLTIGWHPDTSPLKIVAAKDTAIRIVRWDDQQGYWVEEASIVNAANRTVTTISEVPEGIYTLATVKEDIILPGDVVIYNGITPNDDGSNDFFFIDGIDQFPNNSVEIFNRWGVRVFETTGYNESDNVFKGISEGRITVRRNEQLPTGTYFYILQYNTGGAQPQNIKKAGYLYINE